MSSAFPAQCFDPVKPGRAKGFQPMRGGARPQVKAVSNLEQVKPS